MGSLVGIPSLTRESVGGFVLCSRSVCAQRLQEILTARLTTLC